MTIRGGGRPRDPRTQTRPVNDDFYAGSDWNPGDVRRPAVSPRNGRRGSGIGGFLKFLLFALIMATVVLVGMLTVLRPVVAGAIVDLAYDNQGALRVPFVADIVRERLGTELTDPASSDPSEVEFEIIVGDTPRTLANRLADQRLITRVYFPRIIIPLATTLSAFVDFAISAGLLVALMLYYGIFPGIEVVWLPAFILLMLIAALGVGFWLSALNVEYRDVRYALPFLNQFWLFVTPVVYSSSLVPERWQWLYGLNPMVGVIEGFRWALLGAGKGPSQMLVVSAVISVALFVSGIIWFHRREQTFVDTLGTGG